MVRSIGEIMDLDWDFWVSVPRTHVWRETYGLLRRGVSSTRVIGVSEGLLRSPDKALSAAISFPAKMDCRTVRLLEAGTPSV